METHLAPIVTSTAVERRDARRRKTFKGATITFHRGYCAFQCVVRDLTDEGALLALGDTTGIPSAFELQLAGSAEPRKAHVRWRRPDRLGVRFD
jgi:hypothetical protein